MSIAKLSKTRPGEYDHDSKKAVKCIVRGISINRLMCSWLLLYYTIFFLLQQGACIVSPDKRVMAVGFSGYPEGTNPEGTNPEEIKELVKVRFG